MEQNNKTESFISQNQKSENSIDRRLARLRANLPAILGKPEKYELNHFAEWARWFVLRTRARCKRNNIPHTIVREHIEDLLIKQKYRCAVTGIEIDEPTPGRGRGHTLPFGPSVDRIIPELGYVMGNIRVTCLIVNLAMNKWGENALFRLIREAKI